MSVIHIQPLEEHLGSIPSLVLLSVEGIRRETIIQPCNREGGHFKSLFYFSSFFNVKAIRQSLIQHSSISVVAYIRKRGTAWGWDLKYL